MSDVNWAVCPKCKKIETEKKKRMEQEVAESYGKISRSEYLALLGKSRKMKAYNPTLREEYEIGIDAMQDLYVIYQCSCSVCGFEHKLNHTVRLGL